MANISAKFWPNITKIGHVAIFPANICQNTANLKHCGQTIFFNNLE